MNSKLLQKTLCPQERNALQKLIKTEKSGDVVRRAVIVLMAYVFPPSTIQQILGVSLSSIYARLEAFIYQRFVSLKDKSRSGRPAKAKLKELLAQYMTTTPKECGYAYTNWTCHLLQHHLKIKEQLVYSIERIRQVLQALGFSFKMPKHCPPTSPDPQRVEKLARIKELKENLQEGEYLVFQDEADFNLFCPLRKMWQIKGKQKEIPTPGKNRKVYAFGAYEPDSGRFVYRVSRRKRTEDFIPFLYQVMNQWPGKTFMVLDNYSVHHSGRVTEFCSRHADKIELLFLPTYSPQENKIERQWGTGKNWVNANYQYEDVEDLLRGTRAGLRMLQAHLKEDKT